MSEDDLFRPHYVTLKDGTQSWCGSAVSEIEYVREQLRIANVRISACRRVLIGGVYITPEDIADMLAHALAALDFVPSGKK